MTKRIGFGSALIWLALNVLCTASLRAQATGGLSGTITDQSGAAVPDAAIQVKNFATGAVRSAVADDQGRYTVRELPIGGYEVSASKMGFTTAVRPNITLSGSCRRVYFRL